MRTPKQIQASRANGARSKGPVTAQGKRNSSRNSIRHGLLAETVVLEDEHTGRFLELLNDLLDEHQPATPTQTMLVETLATAIWKQKRIWGMQKVAFDEDVSSVDSASESPALRAVLALRASPECVRSHELMLRYEIAFDRQISRTLLRLQQLQERASTRDTQHSAAPEKQVTPAKRTQQAIETATPAALPTPLVKTKLPETTLQSSPVNVYPPISSVTTRRNTEFLSRKR
jgi:hypothetical protein